MHFVQENSQINVNKMLNDTANEVNIVEINKLYVGQRNITRACVSE